MRRQTCIDADWRFHLGDESRASAAGFDDSGWRIVNLPHDWSIEGTPRPDNPSGANGGYFPGGIGWYRKELPVPADLGERHVLIDFDGVYMNSEVFCNGEFCGRRPYGYSSFQYDLTPYVAPGKSAVVSVRVDNANQPNSRWYSGSGIYRHVRLTVASPVRVDHWGTSVTCSEVTANRADITCVATIVNETDRDCDVHVVTELISPSGQVAAFDQSNGTVKAADNRLDITSELSISNPLLWSPDTPTLYTARTTVYSEGEGLDRYDTLFGIRSIRFDPNDGFFLNGANLKLKGVNEHHDAGCVGAAVPDDVVRRRFSILKEMGCNAIRVAHNPASPAFLDLCDRMGFLVVEDAFDEWRDGKTQFGYHLYWDTWWERDLADMIRRDRNHPSIVMWSVGNEIKEVREGNPTGLAMMAKLRETCHELDPTRPMTCGCNAIRTTNAAGYGPLMDVVGYNGGGGSCFDYEKDHETYPDRVMFASEVPHTLQTRGVYRTRTWYRDLAQDPDIERIEVPHLTEEEIFDGFDPHYQSSYDNAMVRISAIDSWRLSSSLPFVCGEFRWSGFDYIGECYGWPAKSWNFGVIDLCGFPKDTYYFYQSQWRNKPMVHILPHWTWPGLDATSIPVVAYTNCEAVELIVNGKTLGTKKMGDAMYLRWDVPYQPGTVQAIGYIDGKPEAECSYETAGDAAKIEVGCDRESMPADGTSIVHMTVQIVDAKGRVVPYARNELSFQITGAATLIGLENGDPLDTTNYTLTTRKAFNGMALAMVQAEKKPGIATVTVMADGLDVASTTITVGD